jgi:RNA polymerase subunit RPABC4/transcription elongation factor Spt4
MKTQDARCSTLTMSLYCFTFAKSLYKIHFCRQSTIIIAILISSALYNQYQSTRTASSNLSISLDLQNIPVPNNLTAALCSTTPSLLQVKGYPIPNCSLQSASYEQYQSTSNMCQSSYQGHKASGPFNSYGQPEDTWYCHECGTLNMDWYDTCPACGEGKRHTTTIQYYATSYTPYDGAGSPAPGSWICDNCGASNSDNTPDFCPICGAQH